MTSPLSALCVGDAAQKCAGKTGLRKSICELESKYCPEAVSAFHEGCVSSVNFLENSKNVCTWGDTVLTPAVDVIAAKMNDPGLSQEFQKNWPTWCQDMQVMLQNSGGDGEKICTTIEQKIAELSKMRSSM